MWKWGRFQSVGFSKLITTGDFPCIWLHHIQLFPLISCPAACASYYFSLLPCHSQLNALPPPIFHSQLSALFQSQLKHVLDPSLDTLNSNDDDDECMFSSCVGYNY
ncbi:unnamed protein product [Prunus armeniaca]|uniref:Uncharacterized protein n=1 Tax=Prunus armeniaca TaxID=36596 RepID=A0A6J5TNB4_PRUAR|nr:hypothetical protein GBA52_002065 [Prunus armeniaca]KAH0990585.1 hypothetical protein GBA52_002068 [Prunus armeniaca]CAB4265586.1 unnamed protein product [Prunus armeniaca]